MSGTKKALEEVRAKRAAAPATKPVEKPTPQKQAEPKPAPQRVMKPRLPDGATFQTVYSAAEQAWTGTLTVEGKTFTAKKSGVFRLLQILDGMYRKSLNVG